jgi:hypothetical protein
MFQDRLQKKVTLTVSIEKQKGTIFDSFKIKNIFIKFSDALNNFSLVHEIQNSITLKRLEFK